MGRAHHVPQVRDGYNGQAEINSYMPEDNNGSRGGVVGEGQGLPEEDESRVAADVNGDDVPTSTLPAIQGDQRNPPPLPLLPLPPPPLVQQQQQPPVGTVVHWERFLPFRSLKVLLVENDDSTRQVVSALLRNCSYEVISVANGLEAWKILKDLSNHVDLVLTEVVMPGLSGIGLLCKIMSHKSCKNIPVIMMSSHDSMGIVFNCLSRGAVDFLVKPIRKNELKNLWQHVWRRCHSSSGSGSGSGSESGIQTQKSIKSKSSDNSDNSGSNDEDKDTSIGLNMRDGSDNGSGTQSSWTKRAAEVESSQPVSPWDQLTDHPDSTCAQVIHLKTESFCNEGISASARKDHLGKENLGNESMTKYLEVGIPREPDKQLDSYPSEKVAPMITTANVDKFAQIDSKKNKQQINEPHCSKATSKLCKAIDLNGAIADTVNPQMPNWTSDASNDLPMVLESKSKEINIEEVPSLELGIKRFTSDGEGVTAANVDRSILRRSELSAFSRYNASAASNLVPAGYGGTCSVQVDDSSEVQKIDPYHHPPLCKASLVNQAYNESSSYNDKGSTTKNAFIRPGPSTEKSATMLTVKATHSSAFHPLQQRNLLTKEVMQEKIDLATSVTISHPKGSCQVQVQHHHHHHHHHHIHSMQQQHPADHEFSLKSMALAAPQCGSSNVFNGSLECNAANYSINGSVSGSHHGSNTLNGSSAAMNIGGTNIENDSGLEGKSAAGGDNGSGLDNNQFSRREAALTKFRQKRKERCFEKKVRYLSRKRLAEQHPRLHGQFVQKAAREQKDQDSDC